MSPTAAKAASVRVAIEKCTTPVGGASKSRIFPVNLEEGGKKKMEKRRRKINKNKNKATEITTKVENARKPRLIKVRTWRKVGTMRKQLGTQQAPRRAAMGESRKIV